jgi:hypothetical protein
MACFKKEEVIAMLGLDVLRDCKWRFVSCEQLLNLKKLSVKLFLKQKNKTSIREVSR